MDKQDPLGTALIAIAILGLGAALLLVFAFWVGDLQVRPATISGVVTHGREIVTMTARLTSDTQQILGQPAPAPGSPSFSPVNIGQTTHSLALLLHPDCPVEHLAVALEEGRTLGSSGHWLPLFTMDALKSVQVQGTNSVYPLELLRVRVVEPIPAGCSIYAHYTGK